MITNTNNIFFLFAQPINVSAVIGRRLGAQQILNSNPHDMSAKKVLEDCDIMLKGWTNRNRTPGKFTGERGTKMDKREIAGAVETWVRNVCIIFFISNLQIVKKIYLF